MPRSSLSSSKSGLTVNGDHKSHSKTNYKKSITTVTRKYNPELKSQSRLVGGADVENEKEELSKETENVPEETKPLTQEDETESKHKMRQNLLTSGPCCVCISQTPGSTGDKKVDDMIEYVHQNLQEAGKALATLGENFEHDSKLVFVDIMGRIQQWSGIVQNKLETCKHDIEGLRKELVARVCEIAGKDREIADLKARLGECETREEQMRSAQATYRFEQSASQPVAEATVSRPLEKGQDSVEPHVDDLVKTRVDDLVETHVDDVLEPRTQAPDVTVSNAQLESADDTKQKIESQELARVDAAVQSSGNDNNNKEKIRRDTELEAEVSRLRRENERIIKERAEYENAIQRALLRGVSSLNVEALKVLRCPPPPFCNPCAPCPVSPVAAEEPIVPCNNTKDGSVHEMPRTCNVQRNGGGKSAGHERVACKAKRPSCSAGKHRRATGNSMVFLLHQGDTETFCSSNDQANSRRCASPLMKKIEIPPCPRFARPQNQCH